MVAAEEGSKVKDDDRLSWVRRGIMTSSSDGVNVYLSSWLG